MMGIHTWRREQWSEAGNWNGEYEYADTEGLTPPEGDGWVLASAFGVGAVPGAGGSPARPARKRSPKT